MVWRIGLLVTCFLFYVEGYVYGSDEEREANIERIVSFAEKYAANRMDFDKFAVAFFCTITTENKQPSENSSVHNIWLVQAVDLDRNRRRYDNSRWGLSATLGVPVSTFGTMVFDEDKLDLFKFGNSHQVVDLKRFPREDGSDENVSTNVVRFNPWNLPIGALSQLQPITSITRHVLQNSPHASLESRWTRDYTLFQSMGNKCLYEFAINEKAKIFQQIVFDAERNLPLESNLIVREDSYNGVMSSVTTEWLTLEQKEDRCIPSRIFVNAVVGNPRAPSQKLEYKLVAHWVFGEDVVDEMFSTSPLLPSVDFIDLILQKSKTDQLRKKAAVK